MTPEQTQRPTSLELEDGIGLQLEPLADRTILVVLRHYPPAKLWDVLLTLLGTPVAHHMQVIPAQSGAASTASGLREVSRTPGTSLPKCSTITTVTTAHECHGLTLSLVPSFSPHQHVSNLGHPLRKPRFSACHTHRM